MYDYSDYVSNKESFWDALISNSVYQAIYQWVLLALVIAILVFVIFTFIEVKKKSKASGFSMGGNYSAVNNVGRLVFCKNCGIQCDSNAPICPKCGARRI